MWLNRNLWKGVHPIETIIEIPANWCSDKNILSGYLDIDAARRIVESGMPDECFVTIKAFYFKDNISGETRTPAAAIRAKFKEKLMVF